MNRNRFVEVVAVIAGLVLFANSFYRGFDPPVLYAKAQWLLSYDFGFVKRGLTGALMAGFYVGKTPAQIHQIINTVSLLIIIGFTGSLLWGIQKMTRAGDTWFEKLLAAVMGAVFASSAFMVCQYNLNGFFDHLVGILAVIAVVAAIKHRNIAVAVLSCLALAFHEIYFMLGFPAVCWAVFLATEKEWKSKSLSTAQSVKRIAFATVMPFAFFGYIAMSSMNIPQETINGLQKAAASSGILKGKAQSWPTFHLTHNLTQNYAMQRPGSFVRRLTDWNNARAVLPTLVLMLTLISFILLQHRMWISLGLSLVPIVCPLPLHLVAWDTLRFTYYTVFNGFLMMMATTLCVGLRAQPRLFGKIVSVMAVAVVVFNLNIDVPLLNGPIDGHCLLGSPPVLSTPNSD